MERSLEISGLLLCLQEVQANMRFAHEDRNITPRALLEKGKCPAPTLHPVLVLCADVASKAELQTAGDLVSNSHRKEAETVPSVACAVRQKH